MSEVFYTTTGGEMVDLICFRHYGYTGGITEEVFAANPSLAGHGPELPAGIDIILPDLKAPMRKSISPTPLKKEPIRLWQ